MDGPGRELYAGQGVRTLTRGFGANDGVRQTFTSKERDNETGLDYFLARYYLSTQGRFTSADEFNGGPVELFVETAAANPTFYADLSKPQIIRRKEMSFALSLVLVGMLQLASPVFESIVWKF